MKTIFTSMLMVGAALVSTSSMANAQQVVTVPADGIELVSGATYPSGTVYANGKAYPPGTKVDGGQTFETLTSGYGARLMPLPGVAYSTPDIVTSGYSYSPNALNNGVVYGAGYNTRIGNGGIISAGYSNGYGGFNNGFYGNTGFNNGYYGGNRGYYGSGYNNGYSGNRGMNYTGGGRGRGGRGR